MVSPVHLSAHHIAVLAPSAKAAPHAAAVDKPAQTHNVTAPSTHAFRGEGVSAKLAIAPSDFAHAFSASATSAAPAAPATVAASYGRATLLTASSLTLTA